MNNNKTQHLSQATQQTRNPPSGLRLSGNVIDRTRRRVPHDNPTTEIVTYTLCDGDDRKHYVDDYAPDSYHDLGDFVSLPVYIKPFIRRNGEASYNICVQKAPSSRGEHF